MSPPAAQPRWRVTWAELENDRRRRAYDAEVEAWHRRNDHLTRLQIEAVGFLGCPQPGLPVDLDDDEVVYRVLPAAELVEAEARHVVGLPPPRLTVGSASLCTPGRALPRGLRIVDAGVAVVTNHRVAFSGRENRREWTYAHMVGPAHHPEVPLTLLHTTDGNPLAGLQVPASAAVNFRFYLTLAYATAAGQRAAVAAQVDALRDAHQGRRPAPPPPAEPDQAPLTGLRPNRRATAAVVVVAFAALTAGTIRSEQASPPYRADSGARGTAAPTDAPNANGATAASTPGKPVADGGTAGALTDPAATRPTGGAPGVDVSRQGTASGGASVPSTIAATGPVAHPDPTTGPAPTRTPPPTTAPAQTTGPAPTTEPPSPEPSMLNLCLDPLRLPLVEPLLCPPANP